MKDVDWTKLAAISEIIGTVAIVISLVFVGVSIRQNTAVVRASQENFYYDLNDRWYSDQVTNPEMYGLWEKLLTDRPLTEPESWRLEEQIWRGLSMWENLYVKYKSGLLTEQQYREQHEANLNWMKNSVPKQMWEKLRSPIFRLDFEDQVDKAYVEDNE